MDASGEVIPSEGMSLVYRTPGGTIVKVLDDVRPELRARVRAMRDRWPAHPNLVTVLEVAEEDGRLRAVLRAEAGRNLRALVRSEGPLPLARVTPLLAGAARGLDGLDLAGVTYADTKTGNLLVEGSTVRLAHSWLAFPHGGDTEAFRSHDRFAGTIDYVAPEVIEGALPDLRSDVYGLGCALYECLTGRVPFPRDSEDATLEAHLHEDPPEAPAAAEAIRRAMAKEPRERYASAGAFAADVGAAG